MLYKLIIIIIIIIIGADVKFSFIKVAGFYVRLIILILFADPYTLNLASDDDDEENSSKKHYWWESIWILNFFGVKF